MLDMHPMLAFGSGAELERAAAIRASGAAEDASVRVFSGASARRMRTAHARCAPDARRMRTARMPVVRFDTDSPLDGDL